MEVVLNFMTIALIKFPVHLLDVAMCKVHTDCETQLFTLEIH